MEEFKPENNQSEKEFEKKLLNPEIASVITELRQENISFFEKAKKLEDFLNKRENCSNVVRFDCDVCIDEYLPQGEGMSGIIEKSVEDKDYQALSETERDEVFLKVNSFIPEEAKTRVQAQTPEGYLTYCFDCEATMCLNQVDYPEDMDWDVEHLNLTEDFLNNHPEYQAKSFRIFGSTRRYICLDIISTNPKFDGTIKEIHISGDKKVKINFTSREFINLIKSYSEKEAEKILGFYRDLRKK